MSRFIFKTIGILLNTIQILFPFWAWSTGLEISFGSKTHPFGGWDTGFYLLCLVVYLTIVALFYFINNMCPPSWWFASPKKRIYHAELGTLWAEISERDDHSTQKEMTIWKQYWLFSKQIAQVEYTHNTELLIQRTKRELDDLYSKRLQKKSKNPTFDEWDGYLDKQSKRDDKLNGIGI